MPCTSGRLDASAYRTEMHILLKDTTPIAEEITSKGNWSSINLSWTLCFLTSDLVQIFRLFLCLNCNSDFLYFLLIQPLVKFLENKNLEVKVNWSSTNPS